MALNSLHARDAAVMAGIQKLRFFPLALVGGKGARVIDESGRALLDLSAAWGSASLGYGHPAIVDAVSKAVANPAGASTLSAANLPAVALAERIRATLPHMKDAKVWLGHSGSDANEAAFRGGWFRSGDEGFYVRDKEGRPFFFISGRIKELIIRGGINISPLEIDEVLRGHPEITFAMAVPFEHRLYGEEIAAYLVPKNATAPPKEADLLAYCRGRLPFAKRPKVFLFGEDIPYTSTGKPKRIELAKRLAPELAAYREVRFVDRG